MLCGQFQTYYNHFSPLSINEGIKTEKLEVNWANS